MDLPGNLAKQFAKAVASNDSGRPNAEAVAYGTVVVQEGETYVRLDGADNLTPVAKAMDAVDGDRVVVSIRNHNAVITGNISSPASARTASSYMKLTEDGLVVGELDEDGEPVGTHSLIGSGMYRIIDENGNTVALFSPQLIKLGMSQNAAISFCNDKGTVRMIDGVLLLNGEDAVGLRTMHVDEDDDRLVAEVVCKWDETSSDVVAALQAYISGSWLGEISVRPNRIDLRTSSDGRVYANNFEVLSTSSLMKSGIINITGKIKANSYRSFSYIVDTLPSEYSLVGISQITTNHSKVCRITEFFTHPSTNTIGVTLCNDSSTPQSLNIRLEWFALYANQDEYIDPVNITLPDEP